MSAMLEVLTRGKREYIERSWLMSSETKVNVNQDAIRDVTQLGVPKMVTLSVQHAFTMFGATVLVPIITGLNISVALLWLGLVHSYST